ncbi:DNA primase [Candidatus Wirthbacteria bacterium CG2_30_54_11]|uniref:DNA primase n=1 Tax=Candidatus Wirthbacteria bacterium CG2_30_54_11 TaxID=1817892 RepID=A0A1J5IUZ9_9BACT|nr:MAG: DNA primase [Candidatus Wirthbacteria bacterium CG2_30_54_11]
MATKAEIEAIKSRLSIVDVVQSYVPLRKAGKNLQALCPFHSEKSPSFMVNPTLNIYKCFGCGESGDIFSFVQKIENCSFGEALELLASKAGIHLSYQKKDQAADDRRAQLFSLNKAAAELFHSLLLQSPSGQKAREYVQKRAISPEMQKQFLLGYAPDSWDTLLRHCTQKGYSLSTLEQIGLVVKSESGERHYDRFRDRLMFPVFDQRDRVCGFSGRALSEDHSGGKYINSPESELFHKSELLYGLNFAQGAIRLEGEAILVEGNVDVITLHQAGIASVVAPLGTALTTSQLRLVKRQATRIFLAFDGDSAGMKATVRSLALAENEGLDVRIIQLPEGKDPDAFVREGLDLWTQAKSSALPVIEYQLETVYRSHDLTSSLGKSNAAAAVLSLIAPLGSPVSRMFYLEKAARRLSTPLETLMEGSGKTGMVQSVQSRPSVKPASPADPTEIEFLRLVLAHPYLLKRLSDVESSWFDLVDTRAVFDALRSEALQGFKSEDFYAKLPRIQQDILAGAVFAWQGSRESELSADEEYAAVVNRLEFKAIRRELQKVEKAVQDSEADDDTRPLTDLLNHQQSLKIRLSKLDHMAEEKEN